MAELLNNSFQELNPEMLKTQEGVNILNNIIKQLVDNVPSDLENVRIFKGYGTPEASVTAGIGSLYMRVDGAAGTTTYQKQTGTGNTGWVAVPGGSGSYSLTVEEQDGAPSVADVVKIKFPNGKVTDDGSGVVSITVGSGTVGGTGTDNHVARWNGTSDIQDSEVIIDDRGQISSTITDSVGANIAGINLLATRTAAGAFTEYPAGAVIEGKFDNSSGTLGIVFGALLRATVTASSASVLSYAMYARDTTTGTVTYNYAGGFGGKVLFDSSGKDPLVHGAPSADSVSVLAASHVLKILDGDLQISGTAGAGQLVLGNGTSTGMSIFCNTNSGTYTPITFLLDDIHLTATRIRLDEAAIGDATYTASVTIPANGSVTKGFAVNASENWLIDQTFVATTNTTLATIAGSTSTFNLEATVTAGKWYTFQAKLFVDPDVVGGHKYSINGTATATSIIYNINSIDNATNAYVITSRQTALAGSAGQAGATSVYTEINGTIKVNAGGTLNVQFAQNASSGTSNVLTGSSFIVKQMYV